MGHTQQPSKHRSDEKYRQVLDHSIKFQGKFCLWGQTFPLHTALVTWTTQHHHLPSYFQGCTGFCNTHSWVDKHYKDKRWVRLQPDFPTPIKHFAGQHLAPQTHHFSKQHTTMLPQVSNSGRYISIHAGPLAVSFTLTAAHRSPQQADGHRPTPGFVSHRKTSVRCQHVNDTGSAQPPLAQHPRGRWRTKSRSCRGGITAPRQARPGGRRAPRPGRVRKGDRSCWTASTSPWAPALTKVLLQKEKNKKTAKVARKGQPRTLPLPSGYLSPEPAPRRYRCHHSNSPPPPRLKYRESRPHQPGSAENARARCRLPAEGNCACAWAREWARACGDRYV